MAIDIKKTIFWLFFCLFFLLPLVFTPYNFELFEFNKTIILFAFAVLIGGLWLLACIKEKKCLYQPNLLTWPLLFFLLSQIISTITSSDKYMSLWGYYSRFHQSLLHTLAYLILFGAYVTWMDKKKTIKIFQALSVSVILISLYGLGQHFGIDANYWIQDVKNRVFSTLGQPNWLASYLLISFFIVSTYLYKRYQRVSNYIIGLILITIWFTKSKSGFLAFWFGLAAFGLIGFFSPAKKQKSFFSANKLFWLIGAWALIISLFIWNPIRPSIFHLGRLEKARPAVQAKTKSMNITPSSKIREIVWQGGVNLWRRNWKNTLIGTGVETFAFNYYLTRPRSHNLTSEWDYIYNKAHNEYLNFLVTTGAIGLISYLLTIIFALLVFWSNENGYRPAFIAGYITFIVANFFGFSVVPTAFLFYLTPAMAVCLNKKQEPAEVKIRLWPLSGQNLINIPIIWLMLWLIWFLISWWRADFFLAKGNEYLRSNYYNIAADYYLKSFKLAPVHPIYAVKLAQALTYRTLAYQFQADKIKSYLATSSSPARKEKLARAYATTEKAVQTNISLINTLIDRATSASPTNLEYLKTKARIDVLLGTIQTGYYQKSINLLKKMIAKAPTDPKITYNLGLIYEMVNNYHQAIYYLKKTIWLKPNYDQAYNNLAKVYHQEKDYPQLKKLLINWQKHLPGNPAIKKWLKS